MFGPWRLQWSYRVTRIPWGSSRHSSGLRVIGPSSDKAISENNSIRWPLGTMKLRRRPIPGCSPAASTLMPGHVRQAGGDYLQQTVRLSPDFASVPGKTRVFRHFGGRAGSSHRQRRAKSSNIAPRRGGVSVGRYSSTAVLPEAVGEIGGIGRK